MKILMTGFKPFLGQKLNPSEWLVQEIQKKDPSVRVLVLPVEFGKSFEVLKNIINEETPDFLIMLGQAAGRRNVCLEKIALNWVQSRNKDEAGFLPTTGPIVKDSELAMMTSFPVDQIFAYLIENKQPVEISFSAGTYVCNELYYHALSQFKKLKSVFVHVPLLPEQLGVDDIRPSMKSDQQLLVVESIVKGLRKITQT